MILKKWRGSLIGKYAQIPNAVPDDRHIGFKALGLYTFLASKPDGWNVWFQDIARKGQDGIKSIRSGLTELVAGGWITITKSKDNTGHFAYMIELHQERQSPEVQKGTLENNDKKPECPKPEVDHPQVDKPEVVKDIYTNTYKNNTQKNNTELIVIGFDEKFTDELIDKVIVLAGRPRPDAANRERWIQEVRAMRVEDGYETNYLNQTLNALIRNSFWPRFIRDMAYFRLKLNDKNKLYPEMNQKRWPKKPMSETPKPCKLPKDFIDWIKVNEPKFFETYGAERTEDLTLWQEAIRTGTTDDSIPRVVEEAKRRRLIK